MAEAVRTSHDPSWPWKIRKFADVFPDFSVKKEDFLMDFPLDRYDYYDYKRVKHGNDEISAKLCGLPDLPIPLQTFANHSTLFCHKVAHVAAFRPSGCGGLGSKFV